MIYQASDLPNQLGLFLPKTLEERKAKLLERINQAWPTFYSGGSWEINKLWIGDHAPGTIVRFYAGAPITFDPVGAVKHGAFWYLSESIGGRDKFSHSQMQAYLTENKLNWVILL